jgi:hypothetical protein
MTMTLQLRKPVDCPVVRVDPNDGSPVVEVQPGGHYTCPAGTACSPVVNGIVWDSCNCSGDTVYVIDTSDGLLGVARVDGDVCGESVEWHWTYSPGPGTGDILTDYEGCPSGVYDGEAVMYYPQLMPFGDRLAVISNTSSQLSYKHLMPGTLSVTAIHGGITYGPITLDLIDQEEAT